MFIGTKNLIKIILIPRTEINLHFVYRNIRIPMISKYFILITSMPMGIRIQWHNLMNRLPR